MRGKNHNIQPLKDRTVFDLPANQEAIFTPDVTKKLLKNRDQESIRKALDYLRNKEENGVNIRSYSVSLENLLFLCKRSLYLLLHAYLLE